MPYETGAKVKLARDVQVSAHDGVGRSGFPGPLFLAEGLAGIVAGSATQAGGVGGQDALASFDQQVRGIRTDPFTAGLLDDLRQRVVQHSAFDGGGGSRIRYRVRFENGFVLDGLEEDWLTRA